MSEFNKYSTNGGATFIDVEDSKAVHYGDQSKGYVGKNQAYEVLYGYALFGAGTGTEFAIGGNNNGCVAIAHVKKNTDYVFSKATGNRCRVVGFSQKPQIDVTDTSGHQFIEDNTKLSLSFNSGNYEWVVCACNSTDAYVGDMNAMVRLASISDNTYEPYLTPNTDLMSYADNAILGAKNLLKHQIVSANINGMNITVNADESIRYNGTKTGAIQEEPYFGKSPLTVGKEYIISGFKNDKAECYLRFLRSNNRDDTISFKRLDNVDSVRAVVPVGTTYIRIFFVIPMNTTMDNTFYPMIRLASDTDNTYVPYAMTNRELTEVQKMTFLNDTTNSRFIKGYKVGRIVNICVKGSFPQNDTYPTLDTPIPLEWQPIESIAVANYSAGMQTGTGFVQLENSSVRISNPANLPYYNTTLSYISKG